MALKKFLVMIPIDGGAGVGQFPMKAWLRDNPEFIPPGYDPTKSTSHQLRLALKRLGWRDVDTGTEIQMIRQDVKAADNPPLSDADSPREEGLQEVIEATQDGEAYFTLEYQLRDFLAANIETIKVNGRNLKLYVDPTGRDGIEYPTPTGPIDILAIDITTEEFIAFELKRSAAPDKAIGQLARYMGWLKGTIGEKKGVHGVIVAKTISDSLRYAVKAVPDVSLFEYEVSFKLNPAPSI